MKTVLTLFFIASISLTATAYSHDDGKIVKKTSIVLPDSVITELKSRYDERTVSKILRLKFYQVTYMSDGLEVTAYLIEPKAEGKYPCIIANRGGNRDFGQWNLRSIALWLGPYASWDYVVIASQYRGNDGGQGIEEFGGKDINDVLNLIPTLGQIHKADTSRIGIEGWSRGGMMTYLALKKSCKFKAAVVGAGAANAFTIIGKRPEMEERVYSELIPNYWKNKDEELTKRSAVFWADQLCKSTPLLIMHGSSDWRVSPLEALELVNKLYEFKHPVRFIFYEGADHGIKEYVEEVYAEVKRHFDYYLRDGNKLPNMELHGR